MLVFLHPSTQTCKSPAATASRALTSVELSCPCVARAAAQVRLPSAASSGAGRAGRRGKTGECWPPPSGPSGQCAPAPPQAQLTSKLQTGRGR